MNVKGRLFDYPPARRDAVARILRRALKAANDIAFAYVHGSFVADRPFHDVDVAVYLEPGARPSSSQAGTSHDPRIEHPNLRAMPLIAQLEAALAQGLERPIPPVDVRLLNQAPLGFCYQAMRGGRLLLSRNELLRVEWAARTVGRYLDLKPLREQALKEAMTACR